MPRSDGLRHPLLLTALLAALSAHADDTLPDSDARHSDAERLDQVTVFASPLRQTAEDLSQPVEVLYGEALDAARAATLGDTLGKLTGVQSSNFGAGVGRPIVRGLDGARVAVLSNGLATQDVSTVSQDHALAIEPFLADQIEVLKGPATLLYGSGAIGGVVNVEDGRIAQQRLAQPLSGRAEVRGESASDGWLGMARVDASAAGGGLVLHADGVRRDLRDYDTPDGTQPNSFVDSSSGAVAVSAVGDDGYVGISLARLEHSYGNPGEPGDPLEGEAGVSLALEQDRHEAKAGWQRDFGIFSGVRASVAGTDYTHTEFEGDDVGTVFFNDATDVRLELTHRPLGGWSGAVGVQGTDREFVAIGEEAFVPRTQTRAFGVFLTEQARFGSAQLDLGARIDDVQSEPIGNAGRSFSPLSLSAGLLWKVDDAWRLSLNLDRAERAPAEEELFANGPHVATASFEIGDPLLREERADQAELGLHYHGERVDAKASVYHTSFDGFIFLRDSGEFEAGEEGEEPLPIRLWTQQDATFRGWEIEALLHLLDDDAGRLDARVFADAVRATLDAGGNLPRIVPQRVGAELRWDADSWRASLGALRYATQDRVADGEAPTAGYTLVDAHAAYHWDTASLGFELFVDLRNLTDRSARVHTSFLRDSVLLPGRNVSAGLRVFF